MDKVDVIQRIGVVNEQPVVPRKQIDPTGKRA